MDPGNFRGVSLINSISKIFTGILTNRLQKWSEENTVLDESQAGFRKNYSTIDNIFSLHAIIQKYLCRPRGRFYCFFFLSISVVRSTVFRIINYGKHCKEKE